MRLSEQDISTESIGSGRNGVVAATQGSSGAALCFHCGSPCLGQGEIRDDRVFCCQGCLTVYELLTANGLGGFYELAERAGNRVNAQLRAGSYDFLDDPAVRERLLDFHEGTQSRVTFRAPAIHCIACVWLLENLFQMHTGIGRSSVNFPRREVSIHFDAAKIRLGEVASLLASLGYEPALDLGELDRRSDTEERRRRRLHLKVGLAGFSFGNIMLFSVSLYAGMDSVSGPGFKALFGWLSLALALPVVVFSASDYWRAAWLCLRRGLMTIDFPIAVGLAAIVGQSVWEVAKGTGEGYFDSLTGLIFFLLIGRVFQEKLYARLSFDRDYKAFFPLSVIRKRDGREDVVPIEPGSRRPRGRAARRVDPRGRASALGPWAGGLQFCHWGSVARGQGVGGVGLRGRTASGRGARGGDGEAGFSELPDFAVGQSGVHEGARRRIGRHAEPVFAEVFPGGEFGRGWGGCSVAGPGAAVDGLARFRVGPDRCVSLRLGVERALCVGNGAAAVGEARYFPQEPGGDRVHRSGQRRGV